jgi:hypothetical protein
MRIDIRVSLVQHESILCHVPSVRVGESPGIFLPFADSSVFSRNTWGSRLLEFPEYINKSCSVFSEESDLSLSGIELGCSSGGL